MLASVGGHHGLLGVQHNGGRDINRVNLGIGQQRSLAVIRTLAAPLGAGLFRQLHIDLHYSNQLGVIRQHHSGNRSAVCNAARADNAPTKLFIAIVSFYDSKTQNFCDYFQAYTFFAGCAGGICLVRLCRSIAAAARRRFVLSCSYLTTDAFNFLCDFV